MRSGPVRRPLMKMRAGILLTALSAPFHPTDRDRPRTRAVANEATEAPTDLWPGLAFLAAAATPGANTASPPSFPPRSAHSQVVDPLLSE